MSQQTKRPEYSSRAGTLSSAVWWVQSTKDGRTLDWPSIKIQNRRQDPNTGEWKGSEIHLFASELPALLMVASKAYEHCVLKESSPANDFPAGGP